MKIFKIILLNLLILSYSFGASLPEDANKLLTKSFKTKEKTIVELTTNHSQNEKLEFLFQKLLKGELLYTKSDKTIVYLKERIEDDYKTANIFTKEDLKLTSKYDFKKIKINNKLRSIIKSSLAKINLFSKNEDTRFKSAKNLLTKFSG